MIENEPRKPCSCEVASHGCPRHACNMDRPALDCPYRNGPIIPPAASTSEEGDHV